VQTGNDLLCKMLQHGGTAMRRIILLILTLASISVFGASDEEQVTVRKVDNQYAISYYNYKKDVTEYFANANLQGSGYTWAALVKAAIKTESPESLAKIEFSPEGGTFIAYTPSETVADKVKLAIEKLSADLSYRDKAMKIASDGGYIE
jgi:hypothetical protein